MYGEDDDYKALEVLCTKIENIEVERNRVAHCVWASGRFDPASGQHVEIGTLQTKIAKKRKIRYDFKGMSLGELKDTAKRIRALDWRIHEFDFSHYQRKKYYYVSYGKSG